MAFHSLFWNSFFSGVLFYCRRAAFHYLPQRSSVLQTRLLSGHTCRYGELLREGEEKKAVVKQFPLFWTFFWRWSVCSVLQDTGTERSVCAASLTSVRLSFAWLWRKDRISLISSFCSNGFDSVRISCPPEISQSHSDSNGIGQNEHLPCILMQLQQQCN